MKITLKQLKQIIKEEVSVIRESKPSKSPLRAALKQFCYQDRNSTDSIIDATERFLRQHPEFNKPSLRMKIEDYIDHNKTGLMNIEYEYDDNGNFRSVRR